MTNVIEATTAFTPVTPTTFDVFIENFATETGLNMETATKVADWLGETGVLDYKEIQNVYSN